MLYTHEEKPMNHQWSFLKFPSLILLKGMYIE